MSERKYILPQTLILLGKSNAWVRFHSLSIYTLHCWEPVVPCWSLKGWPGHELFWNMLEKLKRKCISSLFCCAMILEWPQVLVECLVKQQFFKHLSMGIYERHSDLRVKILPLKIVSLDLGVVSSIPIYMDIEITLKNYISLSSGYAKKESSIPLSCSPYN